MINKSDAQLLEIIADKKLYIEEARQAAIWELEKREVNNDLVEIAQNDITEDQLKNEEKVKSRNDQKFNFISKNPNEIDDPSLPELFSTKTITLFSVLFSTIFGAVLMMINFKELNNQNAKRNVLFFGIVYTSISMTIASALPKFHYSILIINFGGALILTEIFWKNQIGNDFKYRKKDFLVPFLISLLITAILFFSFVYKK